MRWVPGGEFGMGSEDFYPEEAPVRRVAVDGLWMDETPVTVAAFAAFVADTGHLTDAEVAPDPADYPGADPALLVPGSVVFQPSEGPVDLRDVRNWWAWTPGATWRSRLDYTPSITDWMDDYQLRGETALLVPMTEGLSFKASVVDLYNSSPSDETQSNSLSTLLGLSLGF